MWFGLSELQCMYKSKVLTPKTDTAVIPHSMRDPEIKSGVKVAPLRVRAHPSITTGCGEALRSHARLQKCSPSGCLAMFK